MYIEGYGSDHVLAAGEAARQVRGYRRTVSVLQRHKYFSRRLCSHRCDVAATRESSRGVKRGREAHAVYVGLGSNIGDRNANLLKACKGLQRVSGRVLVSDATRSEAAFFLLECEL